MFSNISTVLFCDKITQNYEKDREKFSFYKENESKFIK